MERGGRNRSAVGRVVVIVLVLAMILPVSFIISGGEQSEDLGIQESATNDFYEQNPIILLGGTGFDVNVGPLLPNELSIESYDERVNGYYIVQFDGPVTEFQKARVKQLGGVLGGYVPYNAFIVKMSAETKAQVESLGFVQYVGIYQPAFKFANDLIENVELRNDLVVADAVDFINYENLWQSSRVIGEGEKVPVNIITHDGENPYNIAALIGKAGGMVLDISETGNSVRAIVSRQGIQVLAFLNDVAFIEPYFMPEPALATANLWEQEKTPTLPPDVWDQGLHGEGVVVGIADTGLDTDHNMFRDSSWPGPSDWIGWSGPGYPGYPQGHRKVIRYEQWADNARDESASQHGTHVTSYACGNGDYVGDVNANRFGMAYEAKVSFHDVGANDQTFRGIPSDLKDMYQVMYDDGARLSFPAWKGMVAPMGGRSLLEGRYNSQTLDTDWFMWENKDFLVSFAAGGDRVAGSGDRPDLYPFPATICPPGTAKNIVCVGAHQSGPNWEDIEPYSSFGPTQSYKPDYSNPADYYNSFIDGRLKPDICSDGSVVGATGDTNRDGSADTGYSSMSGTSAAGSVCTGGATLIHQYFKDGYYPVTAASPVAANGFTPSAALVKACLLNGARDSSAGSQANVHDYVLNGHSMDYPNCDQGWGMTDIGDSLYFWSENGGREMEVDDDTVGLLTGQYREYEFFVENTANPLEISLVWTDYKGTIQTAGSLVNDLDLTVTSPGGASTYFGNNYGSSSRQSDAANPAGYDHINNVECALITSPAVGMWKINVSAINIPVGPQPYAVVLTGDFGNNYGWVKFDRHVYNDGDTVQIEVKDTDESGSVMVNLLSSFGDAETVALNEVASNAGRFTATIPIVLDDIIPGNGEISIEDDGWIRAFYNETSPSHSSTCLASTELTNPMISNVHVTDITHTAAIVHWTTDVPATSQVYYGENASLGSATQFDEDMALAHSVVITGLTGFTDYYFDVESTSIGGPTTRDDNGGDHYGFTTMDNPDLFLVLEHSNIDMSEKQANDWRLSLEYYGWTYSVWETIKFGLPTIDDLNTAKAVMWDPGEGYPQLGSDERAVIEAWLNQAGQQLWYPTGQDIGFDMCDASGTDRDVAWFETYLHSRYRRDDADGGGGNEGAPPFKIVGTAHPISSTFPGNGVGLDLEQDVYGSARFWPDDLTNDRGGQIPAPWVYNRNAGGGDSGGSAYDGSDFKCAYEGFSHCMIQQDGTYGTPGHVFGEDVDLDRATVADETLKWLFGEDHPDIMVTYPDGGEMISGTTSIQWSVANADSIDIHISRDGGMSYVVEATGLAGTTTNYAWDTTTAGTYGPGLDFPNGEFYRVKVIGHGSLLTGFDVSDANFTVENGGGDDEGPVIWAGSVKPSPIPVKRGLDLHITAIADDRYKGNSDIIQVEYYVDGTTPAELKGSMLPSDGSFNSPLESAEIDHPAYEAVGYHTLYVRAQDAYANWGGFESVDFFVIPGPPSPPLVDLASPDGGELWMGGSSQQIIWNMDDLNDPLTALTVDITYSMDSGGTYPGTIATGLSGFTVNSCVYDWDPVDMIDSDQVRVRVVVTDTDIMMGQDSSLADFEIDSTPPSQAMNVHAELEGTGVRIYWAASVSTDVDHYEVWWRMNAFDPTGNTYSSFFDVGLNTDVYHANVGTINPSSYSWQIRVFDFVGHETRTTLQAAKYGSTQSTVINPTGWFLLGCPLPQTDTTVEHVLQSAPVDFVRLYRGGVWLSWCAYWPPSLNTLTDIYTDEGFWAHYTANGRYVLAGYIEDKAMTLHAGWNCVAYPFALRNMNTASIDIQLLGNCPGYPGMMGGMLIADHTQPYHLKTPTGTENIFHNQAIWIWVSADTTWTVTNY